MNILDLPKFPTAAIAFTAAICAFPLAAVQGATIANHSFEVDDVSGNGSQLNANIVPTGWAAYDDGRNDAVAGNARGLVYHGPGTSAIGPSLGQNDGSQSFFTAQLDISQLLVATLAADTTYTLSIAIGDRNVGSAGGNPGTPIVYLGYGAALGANQIITMNQGNQPAQVDGDWVEWSGQFTTGASPTGLGEALRIELTNGTNVGWFDNVRLTESPIPEPSTFVLIGIAGLALIRRRR